MKEIGSEVGQRPILRWAGSKRGLVPRLLPLLRGHSGRYVEPFAGSACVFYALSPERAILGDINRGLIETYRVVRRAPERVHRRLAAIPRTKEAYYRWRSLDPAGLDPQTRAVRFIYLNRNCFNGIFRTNAKGEFNVPQGHRQGAYPARAELVACARMLERATLVAGDFEKVVDQVTAGDVVYLDPPYAVETRRVFREYGKKSFASADLARLACSLARIARSGAHFVVSYADCREARRLAAEWYGVRLSVRRNVAGFAGGRRMATEWIITNVARSLLRES